MTLRTIRVSMSHQSFLRVLAEHYISSGRPFHGENYELQDSRMRYTKRL